MDWVTRCGGVYRRPHHHNRRLRYICHGILLSLLNTRGLSGPLWRSVPKDTSPHRRLRYTALLSLLLPTCGLSGPKECIEGHFTMIADFDTHATAYYSACLITPWTEWSAVAECTEGYFTMIAGFDTLCYSACLISPWTEWSEGLYRRPHLHNRRLRYVYRSILLSLLVNNGQ